MFISRDPKINPDGATHSNPDTCCVGRSEHVDSTVEHSHGIDLATFCLTCSIRCLKQVWDLAVWLYEMAIFGIAPLYLCEF